MKKEKTLEDFETKNDKVLEYASSTSTGNERVSIELKVSSKEMPQGKDNDNFANEINAIKARVKRIKDYITSWKRSEFMTSLEHAHVALVFPPIKKTNMILKNPNFQIAMKLWEFLQNFNLNDDDGVKESLDSEGDNIIKGILDDSFLMDYFVLDSISSSKKEQKEKLSKYVVLLIRHQLQRVVSLLLSSGIKITDEEILNWISNEIKDERNKRLVGSNDVKNKFKNAMDEYLERTNL